jgi:glycosyltransferase involved in cell wall biosynthesis
MVATEALARGLPVVAMAVGGLPEAMGTTGATGATSTDVPGVLVPDGDTEGFAAALRLWLGDPEARQRLRAAARSRRAELASWSRTAHEVSEALRRVAPA